MRRCGEYEGVISVRNSRRISHGYEEDQKWEQSDKKSRKEMISRRNEVNREIGGRTEK